jgi:hypothetical protein
MSKSYGPGCVWATVLATAFVCSTLRAQTAEPGDDSSKPHTESGGAADVANKLQNPVADLISIPLQSNFDFGIGPDDRFGYILNIQPVIPIPLGTHLKVVSRSILPVMDQPSTSGDGRTFGLGDWTQSFFFAPAGNTDFAFGIGPVFSIPTGTSSQLGSGKWGIGPTGVALYSHSGLTLGLLTNQIWSFAGPSDRNSVSKLLLQPFIAYTLKIALTFKLQTESNYDWLSEQWTVPLELGLSQTVKLGTLHLSIGVTGRLWVEGPSSAPDWGIQVPLTFVLPAFKS